MSDEEKTMIFERRGTSGEDQGVPETLKATLKVLAGRDSGKAFRLTRAETVIGRGDQVDVRIDDDSMSRRHATVTFRNFEFRIKDLASSNGTYLNGSEVKEYALRNGDKILTGETMFQFALERV